MSSGKFVYNGGVPFTIRQFEKCDFETLWKIDQVCFDPELAYSRPELAFYMRRRSAFTLVAQAAVDDSSHGGAGAGKESQPVADILGFIVAENQVEKKGAEKTKQSGHIITIDVVEKARRGGVGSALLAAAEDRLAANGAIAVELETAVNNDAAIRFYKQKGYYVERTVRGYYTNGLDALVMAKPLVAEQ
jgi:ribosomal-protein-alanine N-acetyltransferase